MTLIVAILAIGELYLLALHISLCRNISNMLREIAEMLIKFGED